MVIEENLKNKSGVYKIYCSGNDKFYIGSAVNLFDRFIFHRSRLRKNKHDNPHLQCSYNKYTEQKFSFHILEYCNKNETLNREQYYLDILKPYDIDIGFNMSIKADGGNYFGKPLTLINLKTGEIKTWNCQKDAAEELCCSNGSICLVVKGHSLSIKGWGLPDTKKYGSGGHNKPISITLRNNISGEIKTWHTIVSLSREFNITKEKARLMAYKFIKEINNWSIYE
jgi:hypothetical protein